MPFPQKPYEWGLQWTSIITLKVFLFLGCLGGSVHWASDFSSGHDQFVSSSPTWRSVLTAQSLEPTSDSVSPHLLAPPLRMLCLSLSLNNKWMLKKNLKIFLLFNKYFLIIFNVYFWERQRGENGGEGEGEREGAENAKLAPCCESRAQHRAPV